MAKFDPQIAFSRNLGWITESELKSLGEKRVAIAGVGGVGGHYCEVLARLGVQHFHLADFDAFELSNFNRQNTSGISTLGKKKLDVVSARIRDINPNATIRMFPAGIHKHNVTEFIAGADMYLDGLDFFVLSERVWIFSELRKRGIPGITVAPVGMGAALVAFAPGSMSFEQYFGFTEDTPDLEKAIRLLAGTTPTLVQRHYQADRSRVNFRQRKAPSTPMGVYLAAGVAGAMVVKLLLGRGPVHLAPWALHFDAYLETYKKTYTWLGAANPLQRLKIWYLRRLLLGGKNQGPLQRLPRYSVQLEAFSNSKSLKVTNVSKGGLGVRFEDGGVAAVEANWLRVFLSPSRIVDLHVKPVWASGESAGFCIQNPPEIWEQFVAELSTGPSSLSLQM